MANSYYSRMYGMFKPVQGNKALKGTEEDKFKTDWKKATDRLKSLNYDFSTMQIAIKK